MNRSDLGPGPHPLRFPGFPAQQAPQNRSTPIVSGRLQNTKLGNGTSWGFGGQVNGAPGLPTSQSRQTGAASSNFAQTIGGSQPATPLDMTEFPSLSGAPQPQYSNPSQAIWGNANQRAIQHTPVQRPQQQNSLNPQSSTQSSQPQQNQQPQEGPHQTNDELFPTTSRFTSGIDDYRHGGQGGVGQLSGTGQPQTGNIEEFPPLGRNGNDDTVHDQRGSLMQNAAFGGFSSANTFTLLPNPVPNRHGLPNSSQSDTSRASALVNRSLSPSHRPFGASTARSPVESGRQGQTGASDHEQNVLLQMQKAQQQHTSDKFNSLLHNFHEAQITSQQASAQAQSQATRLRQGYPTGAGESPGAGRDQLNSSQMIALDRFGLHGFLATVRSENPDVASLAIGQDLTQLGLNLNSTEPLYPTFAGPFAEAGSRAMQPDFRLPDCYTVDNIHKVVDKLPGFSDETLFWIFYTQPKDIIQEQAATELTSRNWRYHKGMMMWVTKDHTLPDPVQISPEAEKGSYIFFNHNGWTRQRADYVLHYDDLDNHIPVRGNMERDGRPMERVDRQMTF